MNRKHTKFSFSRAVAVALVAALLLVGTLTAAYAADVGGLKKAVRLWIHGAQKDAMIESVDLPEDVAFYNGEGEDISENSGHYAVTWIDENGESHSVVGGGVSIEADGVETPVSMEEYLAQLESSAEAELTEDGRVMLYWFDKAVDITDQFENGVCELSLERDGETWRFTVEDRGDGGYSVATSFDSEEGE